jgi:hypothetical protein
LRGVYQDYLNFYANKLFKEKTFLTGGSVSLRSIEDTIKIYQPNIIWISGHGGQLKSITERDGFSEYLLTTSNEIILDTSITKMLSKNLINPTVIFVDACHSQSIVDLNYSFKNDVWVVNENSSSMVYSWSTNVILIAAAADNLESFETDSGGFFTLYINDLLSMFKYLTIDLIIKNWKRSPKIQISSNTNSLNLINRYTIIFNLE